MKEPIILRDINQIKKHSLRVCGQEPTILVKYLETFSLFLRPRDWGIFWHKTGCRMISPAVPWRFLPCQYGQHTTRIIPPFLGVLIPNTQGCDCSACLNPERYFAALMGDEPHRSAKSWLHGAWNRGAHWHLLLLAAFAWWFMKWEDNSQPPHCGLQSTRSFSSWPLYALKQKCWLCIQTSAYIKPPLLW